MLFRSTGMIEEECTLEANNAEETMLVGNIVKLEQDATRLVTGNTKNRGYGKLVLPCSFGGSSFYGLFDLGASRSLD